MKTLKHGLSTLLLLAASSSILSAAPTFEQTGVKEGNNRVSLGIYTTVPDGGDASVSLYGEFGHFLTDDIELSFAGIINRSSGETFYNLKPGAKYYFLKTPTLTPYVGTNVYYFDSTQDNADATFGNNYHVGAHKFFTENVAVTGEAGLDFFEFTDYLQSYTNIYFTYFFD